MTGRPTATLGSSEPKNPLPFSADQAWLRKSHGSRRSRKTASTSVSWKPRSGDWEDVAGYASVPLGALSKPWKVRVYRAEGYVDDPKNPAGIVISVDVLQQGLLVRVPVENLEALP